MRNHILTLLLVMFGFTAFSQAFKSEASLVITLNGSGSRDTILLPSGKASFQPFDYRQKNFSRDTLILKIPNKEFALGDVKIIGQLPQKYIGNNGNGSDIYQDQRDNMMVLKPDKSFSSKMPNAINQVLLSDTLSIQPGRLPRIYRVPNPKK